MTVHCDIYMVNGVKRRLIRSSVLPVSETETDDAKAYKILAKISKEIDEAHQKPVRHD